MKILTVVFVVLLAATCGSAFGFQGMLKWLQEPYLDSPNGYSSQDARNEGGLGWFAEVADDFLCEDGIPINHIKFWGMFYNPQNQHGNIEGFMISFYDYDPGPPSKPLNWRDPLYRNDFPFRETLLGRYAGWDIYEYDVDLDPYFEQEEGNLYFVSVVAILARGGGANEPQWGWCTTREVWNDSAVQWFFDPGNFSPLGVDMAFGLYGVPEPAAFTALAGVLLGLGAVLRRRR